jgi:hypothetical protein
VEIEIFPRGWDAYFYFQNIYLQRATLRRYLTGVNGILLGKLPLQGFLDAGVVAF